MKHKTDNKTSVINPMTHMTIMGSKNPVGIMGILDAFTNTEMQIDDEYTNFMIKTEILKKLETAKIPAVQLERAMYVVMSNENGGQYPMSNIQGVNMNGMMGMGMPMMGMGMLGAGGDQNEMMANMQKQMQEQYMQNMQINQMKQMYGEDHPMVKNMISQMQTTQQINQMKQMYGEDHPMVKMQEQQMMWQQQQEMMAAMYPQPTKDGEEATPAMGGYFGSGMGMPMMGMGMGMPGMMPMGMGAPAAAKPAAKKSKKGKDGEEIL